MNNPLNITFEVLDEESANNKTLVTFYHIDAITSKGNSAVIISGGKQWHATATYEEIWEKLKKRFDEIAA
jgi:ribosomal silencing factor RsfS